MSKAAAAATTTTKTTTTTTTTTRLEALQKEFYPSLNLSTLLANPQAHLENKRFIHEDLNRQFTKDALLRSTCSQNKHSSLGGNNGDDNGDDNGDGDSIKEKLQQVDEEGDGLPRSVESLRAREIDLLLGPKFIPTTSTANKDTNANADENKDVATDAHEDGDKVINGQANTDVELNANEDTSADVVIDLHTTTSNMGIVLIVAEGDPIMTRAAAYVMFQINNSKDSCGTCSGSGSGSGSGGNDNSNGDNSNADRVKCLLHTHPNRDTRPNVASTARHGFTIEVGPVPQGVLRHDIVEKTERALFAMLEYLELNNSDEGRSKLDSILKSAYGSDNNDDGDDSVAAAGGGGGGEVPCFKSAKAKKHGEMSGKITWPTCDDNPNFPAVMVHKHLQDRDFELIHEGDALFVDLHGNIIPYDGSHGSPVYLMFVNEGGYYYKSSGAGIAVATKAFFDLETGLLVREEEVGYGNGHDNGDDNVDMNPNGNNNDNNEDKSR